MKVAAFITLHLTFRLVASTIFKTYLQRFWIKVTDIYLKNTEETYHQESAYKHLDIMEMVEK